MNVYIYNDVLCTKLYTCKSQKKNVPSNVAHVPTVLVFFHRYFKRFRVVPCFLNLRCETCSLNSVASPPHSRLCCDAHIYVFAKTRIAGLS